MATKRASDKQKGENVGTTKRVDHRQETGWPGLPSGDWCKLEDKAGQRTLVYTVHTHKLQRWQKKQRHKNKGTPKTAATLTRLCPMKLHCIQISQPKSEPLKWTADPGSPGALKDLDLTKDEGGCLMLIYAWTTLRSWIFITRKAPSSSKIYSAPCKLEFWFFEA